MRWEFDNGALGGPPRWTPCAPELEAHLNGLVVAGGTSAQIRMGPFSYLLELMPAMRQVNLNTGRSRDLRPAADGVSRNLGVQPPPAAMPRTRRDKRKASSMEPSGEEIVHSSTDVCSSTSQHEHIWAKMEFIKAADLDPSEHCHICLVEFVDDASAESSGAGTRPSSAGLSQAPTQGAGATRASANTEPLDCVKLPRCHGHYFHSECIKRWFAEKPKCPSCGHFYGQEIGTQPAGTMYARKTRSSLPGYDGCGSIDISYHFPSGVQSSEHPNPGKPFYGTSRSAYLPDNEQGRKCLRLLQQAFRNRVCFTVGTSLTTHRSNAVIWNGIHHKTSRYGGPTSFGYPDPTYLNRLEMELASKGVTEDSLPSDPAPGSGESAMAKN